MPRYEKKITLGRDRDGKLVRKSIYGNTKSEVEKKVFQAKQEWLQRADSIDNSIAFMTFARRWLATEKEHAAINTKAMYENVIEKHLAPDLSELYFSEIAQTDLQGIINRNFNKYETCNKIKLTLRQIYDSAIDSDIEIHKTVNIKKLVIPKKEKNEKRALTKQEIDALSKAKLTDKQKAFVNLLYYCGLRREEVLALDHNSIDFKTQNVKVSNAVVFDKNTPKIERTKNTYSNRAVPIPAVFMPFLREYVGDRKGLLFCMSDGTPMTKSSFVKFWLGIQTALSEYAPTATTLTPHIFRHNYATQLYYSEISVKKAAQLLGHADTTMLMRVYSHLDEQKENAVEKLNLIFS